MAPVILSGKEKAAILLITLGPEKSSQIFKHLKEDEIETLTLEIANISTVMPDTKDKVMQEFYQICLAQQYITEGGIGYAKQLLEKALGQQKAFEVISKPEDLQCMSACVISDTCDHGALIVHSFICALMAYLKATIRDLEMVHYFSDGASSKYKNHTNFRNLCYNREDFGTSTVGFRRNFSWKKPMRWI